MKKRLTMRSCCILLASFCITLLTALPVHAQTNQITGTIKDEKGTALPGVTVTIKGTKTSTASDEDGKFTITAPAQSTLVLSHVGFVTKEVPLTGETNLTIAMKEQAVDMNEVVVVGYGTQKKGKPDRRHCYSRRERSE